MLSEDLFASQTKRGPGLKIFLIAAIALVLIGGTAYAVYRYSIPVGPTAAEIRTANIGKSTVMLLGNPTFSGDELRQQILGKGRIVRYVQKKDEVYFTFPQTDESEFEDFLNTYIKDLAKVDMGANVGGEIMLGDYGVTASPEASRFFRTNVENVKIDTTKVVSFPYHTVNYAVSLGELLDLTDNSEVYGGKVLTEQPTRKYQPLTVFANHGIMVAKPDEPSLKRLTGDLLNDTAPDREARIQRLVDFVSNEIDYSYIEAYSSRELLKRPSETLMTRNGDCSNKTILLASLLEQIGEQYVLLYCPHHITVAVPQGNFPDDNKLDFTWNGSQWMIAETTLPGFQIGKTRVADASVLNLVQFVQDPKNADVIIDANSYEVLKFL